MGCHERSWEHVRERDNCSAEVRLGIRIIKSQQQQSNFAQVLQKLMTALSKPHSRHKTHNLLFFFVQANCSSFTGHCRNVKRNQDIILFSLLYLLEFSVVVCITAFCLSVELCLQCVCHRNGLVHEMLLIVPQVPYPAYRRRGRR